MIWSSLSFDTPYAALLLLLLIPSAWLFLLLYRWRKEAVEHFAAQGIRDKVLTAQSDTLYWIKALLISIAFTAAIAAIAEPKGNGHYPGGQMATLKQNVEHAKGVIRKKMHEVIILIDVSASMGIKDTEAGKSRLETAKEIVDQVISSLRGESVTLYPFTSSAMRAVPLTMDYIFTRLMLNQLSINEGETTGTNIQRALEAVRDKYLSVPPNITQTVIILSDGGDTSLYGLDGNARNERISTIVAPLAAGDSQNLAAYAVGTGSIKGDTVPDITFEGKKVNSSLDELLMKRLALIGRGVYFSSADTSPFRIAQEISRLIAKRGEFIDAAAELPLASSSENSLVYDLYFQAPLAAAIAALLIALFLPETLQKSARRSVADPRILTEAPE